MASAVPKHSGFSMLEVLVSIVIVAVGLLGMAGLSARSTTAEYEAYQRAQALILLSDMVMTLAYARNEAINRNAQVSVVAFGTWTAGWQVVAGGTPLRQTALSGEITVAGPASSTLTYNPDGRLSNLTTLRFVFSVPGNTDVLMRCVSATLMGQPVLQTDANRDGDCTNG